MTASRFVRRPRREADRSSLVGVTGPRLFVESLEDRVTPAYNPNPLFVAGNLVAPGGTTNSNGAPQVMVAADINGDGRDDFAGYTATSGVGFGALPRIDVYLSNGATGSGYTVQGISPFTKNTIASLTAFDATADGKAEIATVSQETGRFVVYRLDNTGTFSILASQIVEVDSKGAPNLALGGVVGGDFNNDGKGDFMVTLTGSPNGNEYFVMYNNGDGKSYTAIPTPRKTAALSTNFTEPVAADFDGDGNTDVAMLNAASKQVVVLFGDGAAGVSFSRVLGVTGTPTTLAVGDFDHNGKPDLAVGQSNGRVTLFLKDATSNTFTTKADAVVLGSGAPITGLAAGDFDVDLYADLAIATAQATPAQNLVDVYLGAQNVRLAGMTQAAGGPYSLTGTAGALVTVDLDRNGNPDFVAAQGLTTGQVYTPFVNQSGVGGETFLTQGKANIEFGQTEQYDVVIYPPPLGGNLPTGTVTFFDVITDTAGNKTFTNIGSAPLTASLDAEGSSIAVTTFTTSALSVGQHTVIGKYSGDANYPAVSSNTQTVTVSKATTTAVLASSVPNPVFGQPVTLTVGVGTAGGLVPDGNVSFFDNGNLIGSGTLDGAGKAALTVPNFALGNHALSVQYLGSANFSPGTSNGVNLTVAKSNSTTSIGINKTSATFGDAVTLSSTVGIAAPGVGTPTGTVQFFEGANLVGQGAVNASTGFATAVLAGLTVGTHTFVAKYTGNASVAGSQSGTVSVTVAPTGSVAGLVATPTNNQIGTPVKLTAFVNDAQARPVSVGTVTFFGVDAAGKNVAVGPVGVSNGQAVGTVTGLPLGTSSFNAVFSGTASISASTSNTVTLFTDRNVPATATSNSTGGTSTVLGKDVTFTTQYIAGPGLPAPVTGTATFTDNGKAIGTVTLANGVAALTTRLGLGVHTIAVAYSGDGIYAPTTTSSQFSVTSPIDPILVGAGSGGTDIVRVYNPDGSITKNPLFAFGPDNTSGARVASGDVNGDGVQDYVIGAGPGTQARVRVFDGATSAPLFETFPFEGFTGGVFVTVGDINGDLRGDIIVTPDQGGGPRVSVFDGQTFRKFADFFGIDDPNFRGGARAAVGDVNKDGAADLVVAAGFGGGPRVAAFDGRSVRQNAPVKLFNDFLAFDSSLRNGVYVAVGDVDGDGFGDIIAGAGPGGGPRVIAVSGSDLVRSGGALQTLKANFFAGDTSNRGGVPVAVRTLDGDALADIVTGSGPGAFRVNAYLGKSITPNTLPVPAQSFDAFDPAFNPLGGVFVG